jgi:MFS family permease
MTVVRLASLMGVALLVMVLNIAMSVVYMVVYSHLINPGHPEGYYHEHIKVAAPYCSIVAGIPLMFMAGLWVAGWWGGQLGVKAALVVWLGYAIIDLGVSLAAGLAAAMTPKLAVLYAISLLTKLAAGYLGALVAVHNASQNAAVGPG